MPAAKPPKKSETLEVRLPHATKSAFMTRCRTEGRTASDAVRGFIDHELGRQAPIAARAPSRGWQAVAAAALGLAIGTAAVPSLAQTPSTQAAFDRLDRNHDGVLKIEEFARR